MNTYMFLMLAEALRTGRKDAKIQYMCVHHGSGEMILEWCKCTEHVLDCDKETWERIFVTGDPGPQEMAERIDKELTLYIQRELGQHEDHENYAVKSTAH